MKTTNSIGHSVVATDRSARARSPQTTDAMHHSQEATDTALDWCIELISQSNVLEVGAKYAILVVKHGAGASGGAAAAEAGR